MNLDRQIKRHVIAGRHEFFAVTHPGFESICVDELQNLSNDIDILETVRGGVAFHGRLMDFYRCNLELRTAGRLLMRLARFKSTNFKQLEYHTAAIPWARYLPSGVIPDFRVTTRQSRLYHSRAVAQRMRDIVAAYWQNLGVSLTGKAGQNLWVRLKEDKATLSLDGSGGHLYRRGFKTHRGRAPLRETLAAAILYSAGFRSDRPLVDPMCGAGTFSLEAALMAKRIPPGYSRDFAFIKWPAFRPRQWRYLKSQAGRAISTMAKIHIFASDADETACRYLSRCVADNGLNDAVQVDCRDFFNIEPDQYMASSKPGLIVLNPPHGRRLTAGTDLKAYYKKIGAKLSGSFKGWRAAILIPSVDLARDMPSGLSASGIVHGGQNLRLLVGIIA